MDTGLTPTPPRFDPIGSDEPPALGMLAALNRVRGATIYQGTVPFHVKQQRRAAGKRARAARKISRGRK